MKLIGNGTVLVLIIVLFGCSTHPLQEDVTRTQLIDIIHKIRCEAREAIKLHDIDKKFDRAVLTYQFDFIITENNGASADIGLKIPVSQGTFSVGFDAAKTKQRKSDRQLRVVELFKELRLVDCLKFTVNDSFSYPIKGTIGLNEVIGNFIHLANLTKRQPADYVDVYRDELSFTTAISGSVNPSISLAPSIGRTIDASLSLGADRTDLHKIRLQFTPPPAIRTLAQIEAAWKRAVQPVELVTGVLPRAEPEVRQRLDKARRAPSQKREIVTDTELKSEEEDELLKQRALRDFERQSELDQLQELRDILRETP